MIKRFIIAAMACLAAFSVQAQANKLNLFIWSEYIDPEVVKDFEKKFDCKVTIDLYEDESAMLAKIQGGGSSMYDVVVPPDQTVPSMVKLKLLSKLRHENIPNLKNIESRFLNPPYDAKNTYSAPYMWGTVGLYVRQAKGKTIEPTWGLIFDAKKQPGPFILIDSSRECIGAALKYLGYSINSTDTKELKQARELLLEAKKRALAFESGVGGKNKVVAKGATMAMVYNGDAVRGMGEDKETQYILPREGGEIWVDNLVVLAKAPHRDMAEKFINYLLDAEVGAKLAKFIQYATPNEAARKLLSPEELNNPSIYPSADVAAKLEFLKDAGSKSRLYDEIWTQIKAK